MHPPLAYLMRHAWQRLGGENDLWLKSLSIGLAFPDGGQGRLAARGGSTAPATDTRTGPRSLERGPVVLLALRDYQIIARLSSGRTMASPGLQPNALANSGMLETGPFTRHSAGECGSVLVSMRVRSGRILRRHAWA